MSRDKMMAYIVKYQVRMLNRNEGLFFFIGTGLVILI